MKKKRSKPISCWAVIAVAKDGAEYIANDGEHELIGLLTRGYAERKAKEVRWLDRAWIKRVRVARFVEKKR